MKKLLVILSCLFVLTACGSAHYTTVSEGDTAIFTYPDGSSYSKNDLYTTMKNNDITDLLTMRIVNKLAELEGIDVESIKSEVTESVNSMVESGYESFITSYYGSVDNYISSSVSNQALNKLSENEINNNFDKYVEDYAPYKAEIVYFDDKDTAQAVLDVVNNKENTFEYACTDNGYEGEVSETLYTDSDSDLPVEVKDYVLNAENTGLSDIIEVSTTMTDSDGNSTVTPRYYLVNLISKNVEDFKDEFISKVSSDIDSDTTINTLLEKYGLEAHDQRVYELLKAKYEAVK